MEIPTATYRIQFNPAFGFRETAGIVSYLADLGISHLYASPIFNARRGSPHGYDGVDPNQLNPELGAMSDFQHLHRRLAQNQIGWLQDIVPNHLAFDSANRMLMEVLQNGSYSRYYRFFDIDWDHCDKSMRGRLLTPFLGHRLAQCLQNRELKLSIDAFGFAVNYYHLRLPLQMESYTELLQPIGAKLRKQLGGDLDNLIRRIKPAADQTLWGADMTRQRLKQSLTEILAGFPVYRTYIDRRGPAQIDRAFIQAAPPIATGARNVVYPASVA